MTILHRRNPKKDNSETDLDGRQGRINQVRSTRSGQLDSKPHMGGDGGGGGKGDRRIYLAVLGSEKYCKYFTYLDQEKRHLGYTKTGRTPAAAGLARGGGLCAQYIHTWPEGARGVFGYVSLSLT